MINKGLFILCIGLFFASCGERPLYSEVYSFDNKTWNQTDTATFNVIIEDTLTPYQSTLLLRTTTDYLYSNLWVYVDIVAPDGVKSTVAYPISITRPDGSWIGTKSGTIVESKLIFGAAIFPMKGKYTYSLRQAVNQKEVENTLDIGLLIEKPSDN